MCIFADGHGMLVKDFMRSADASMGAISKPEIGVGERILGAVEQTWQAVACNTNLGIVLLAAPLIQTSLIWMSLTETSLIQKSCEHGALSEAKLGQVLQSLSVEDAKYAFKAIQLASPAGLGKADEHDVHHVPDDTLLAAMRAAAGRDLIAQQYANGFADVFAGVQVYVEHLAKWERPVWAVTAVYLSFLAKFEDSHIARKYGQDVVKSIQKQAQQHYAELTSLENPKLYQASLLSWDAELKKQGINPGTSADLTVATILANSLMNI
jgi:triphosphoribosyl-dephospho-CoA synthase